MKKTILLSAAVLAGCYLNAQEWETLESLPPGASIRHHPGTFSIDGVGYLVSGSEPSYNSLKDFYSYDPETDEWTQKDDFPGIARGFGYAVESEDKGYLGFGLFINASTGADEVLNDLWEYDPVSDEWTELASCPCDPRWHPAMVYLNDKIYMGLGGSDFGDLGDWWEYDIPTDTWTEKATFPASNRHHPYYFSIGDYAYVGMGHSGPNIFDDFYRYDPATDTWEEMAELPGQGRVAGTQFTLSGKGYILSGQGETHSNLPTGEMWVYDPELDEWEALDAHPGGGRWAPGSFVIDGGVYFTCGQANTGEKKDLMRYQIEGFVNTEEVEELDQITVYPNPSNGVITITNITGSTNLNITDMNGKNVWNGTVTANENIDLSALETGVYICQIKDDTQIKTQKLIIE